MHARMYVVVYLYLTICMSSLSYMRANVPWKIHMPSILCGIFRVHMCVRVCGRRGLGLCSVATIEASVYVGMYLCSVLKPNSRLVHTGRDFLCRQERCGMTILNVLLHRM